MEIESGQLEKIKELYNLVKNDQFDPSNFQLIVKTNQYLIKFNTNFKFIYDNGKFGIASLNDERYKDTISKSRFILLCAITGACSKGIDFTYNIENIYQSKILNIKYNSLEIYSDIDSFYGMKEYIESAIILDSVTSIGIMAFCRCTSLTSVTIPNSVTNIMGNAFVDCKSLVSITIPDSVTEIQLKAFWNCESLTSVTLPKSITYIGLNTFRNCKSLVSITIPDSVTYIGSNAFSHCSSLTSIIIPDSVTIIRNCAFYGCESLVSITIPDSVTYIGNSAFAYCTSLTSIIVPDQKTAEVVLENNPNVKDKIKIQPMNESKYSRQQLLEAIDYWTNILNEYK